MFHSRQLAAVMAFVVTLSLTLSGKPLSPNAMAEMRPASIVSRGDLLTLLYDMQDSAEGYAECCPPRAARTSTTKWTYGRRDAMQHATPQS
ncbi:hypothetical protein DIPPA_27658 [Diplonema papillatum]|nr:hypothetical protein DIPPA_27658 [Diplonema papillatum]